MTFEIFGIVQLEISFDIHNLKKQNRLKINMQE